MAVAKSLGAADWFALGDGDLALHVLRTQRLRQGDPLTAITADFARSWNLRCRLLPMSEHAVRTVLTTDAGELEFQHYFVARRCLPVVSAIRFEGAAAARPADGVLAALADPTLRAILIAPSNPYLSIDPILAVPGLRGALTHAQAPVVAISPLIGGKAVKGPTAKLMAELGVQTTTAAIAAHYAGLIRGLLIDRGDPAAGIGVAVDHADTLMRTLADRTRVAAAALAFADRLR
jgi:LPPG:FO 2-phospho-L-lactate transferase